MWKTLPCRPPQLNDAQTPSFQVPGSHPLLPKPWLLHTNVTSILPRPAKTATTLRQGVRPGVGMETYAWNQWGDQGPPTPNASTPWHENQVRGRSLIIFGYLGIPHAVFFLLSLFLPLSLFSPTMFILVRSENHRVYIEALPPSKIEGVRKNISPSLPITGLLLVLY